MDWKNNKNVIVPTGTRLSERMFQYNHIVETITLPDDITFLPEYFCFGCNNLKAIYGGHNVKIVSYNTFNNSPKLHHIDFIPKIGYRIYDSYSKKHSLKVVRELKIADFTNGYLIDKKQFGYVIHKQNDEYLIWDVTAKKYVYAVIHLDIPLYSYIVFLYKDSILYDDDNAMLNIERNFVDDVSLANDEDVDKFIHIGDAEAYINGAFSYINKINAMKTTILNYIDSLNVKEIIESYTVSIDEHIRTKIGDDDTYALKEYARSNANPSDVYLGKLLPSYSKETKESGYCTFSYMTDKEKETYKDKEKSVKFEALQRYSKGEHITSLIDAYIRYLFRRTNIYQEVLDAVNILNKNREYIRSSIAWNSDYSFYWDDISQFTFKLNEKLNYSI